MLSDKDIDSIWVMPPERALDILPALALGESQEDEAEPIEILIYAHTDAGHEALLRLVTGAGGRID